MVHPATRTPGRPVTPWPAVIAHRHGIHRGLRQWFRDGAVVLDTETTGLQGHAVEISIVELGSGTVLFDSLISPGIPISAGATRVHGITAHELEGAPALAEVATTIRELLRGRTVLAYDAPV